MQPYSWLLSRLDAFIRKYYANQLLRGGLILLICLLAYVLTASVSEYYLYLPVAARVTIVSAFLLLGGSALIFWIIIPLLKIARLGKTLSHDEAARIIGRHFPEISDKLLNILQLKRDSETAASRELLEASIDQKASLISVVPIARAVDLSKNRRYLPYLLPLLGIGIFIFFGAPNVFRDASQRLLQPTKTFERPAPFQFDILTQPLVAVRNSDFVLKAKVTGTALPQQAFIEMGGERIPMQALDNHIFQYVFKNVTDPITFQFFASGFTTKSYTLAVAQKPLLKTVRVQLDYPAYTGKKSEQRNFLGDMTVPTGTRVSYGIMAEHTDAAVIRWASGATVTIPKTGNIFSYAQTFLQDTSYTLAVINNQTHISDSFRYKVQVIQDQYPVIQVQEHRDTVSGRQVVLLGTAGDDYGISRVVFHYNVETDKGVAISSKAIQLHAGGTALAPFQQYFDIGALNLQAGQKVSYYIEAFDNDGVHGPKSARSGIMTYQMFTPKQLDSSMNVNAKQINSGLSNSAQQTKEIQKDMQEAESKLLQTNEMDFAQQQNLQELSQKQEELKAKLEATQKRMEEQKRQSEQKQYSEDVKEKQEELKKQMDNVLNKELAEQMKKLDELRKKLNKQEAFQEMQQMQEDNKLFNMDLQRMQELMKQLEAQMRMEDLANKFDKMAQDQKSLQQKTEAKKEANNALKEQQKDLQKQLNEAVSKDMKELQELSKSMQQKPDVAKEQKQAKDAGGQMEKSEEEIEKENNSGASEEQKKASDNLQQMANSMRMKSGGANMEQIKIDIRATRQILTNLIRLSFDQEKLMGDVRQTPITSNNFLINQTEQSRLHDASRVIRDSLFVLSKRIFKLAPSVNKETKELESNMGRATSSLEGRLVGDALTRQQYVMTHTNNLALMLNELLANLMQMESQSKGGSGSCNSPGGKKPKPGAGQQLSDIITQQQSLGNSMKQAQQPGKGKEGKEGKDGKEGKGKDGKEGKDGGKEGKTGENGGGGGQGTGRGQEGTNEYGEAEKLARLAQQQAAIRRQLQDLQQELNGRGGDASKELREIQQQMDRNEEDLVNRRITSEMQMRQEQILTRMLKAEKALREQDQDDKRSSNNGKTLNAPVPAELQRFLQARQDLMEFYQTVPPQLKPYYKQMVEQYFRNIGGGK